jgi:hypothetical protein
VHKMHHFEGVKQRSGCAHGCVPRLPPYLL